MASLLRLRRAPLSSASASATAFARRRVLLPTLPPSSGPSSSSSPWPPPAATMGAVAASEAVSHRGGRRSFCSIRPNYRSRCIHRHCRTILRVMHLRGWDATLELELAASGITLTQNIVDQVIGCIPSPKLALQFFIWAGEQIGFPPPISKATYDITQWYAHKSQTLSFLSILRSLRRPHYHLSPSKVNVLLQGYGWAGMLDRAYNILSDAQGFSNAMLVNCFLFSIIKERRYDMVYNVYIEMKQCGTPLHVCYNSLIYGMSLAAGSSQWQEADLLFKQMVDTGQVPNVETCNALIVSVSRAGKHDRACELLLDMISWNTLPENTTFTAVIECLCHARQLQRASKLIEEMKQHGCTLDPKIYHTLLGALKIQRSYSC